MGKHFGILMPDSKGTGTARWLRLKSRNHGEQGLRPPQGTGMNSQEKSSPSSVLDNMSLMLFMLLLQLHIALRGECCVTLFSIALDAAILPTETNVPFELLIPAI